MTLILVDLRQILSYRKNISAEKQYILMLHETSMQYAYIDILNPLQLEMINMKSKPLKIVFVIVLKPADLFLFCVMGNKS